MKLVLYSPEFDVLGIYLGEYEAWYLDGSMLHGWFSLKDLKSAGFKIIGQL